MLKRIVNSIPEFCMSHWLLRVPLAIVFIQQGISKWPIDAETAASWELPLIVWAFVVLGEIGAGLGLLAGGVLNSFKTWVKEFGDIITRFSGITITCIMTGVIWMAQPTSLTEVLLYDNFHVLLWVGGLYFGLRGNRT